MKPLQKNALVGLVVLTAMFGLAWMILKLANQSTTFLVRGTRFQLQTNRADGLSDGSPVLFLGVNVGRVTRLARRADNRGVVVDAVLNSGENVPANVEGIIRPQSALGASAEVDLEPIAGQSPSEKPLGPGAMVNGRFAGAGLIPPEFAKVANQISQQQLAAGIRRDLDKIGQMIDQIKEVLGKKQLQEDLPAAIASIRTTADNLNQFSGRLQPMGDDLTATIHQVRTTVSDASQKFNGISGQFSERLQQLAAVLDRIDSITAKIDKGQGSAGKLVNDDRLYESLLDSSRDLDVTFKDLQRLADQWAQDGFTLKLK